MMLCRGPRDGKVMPVRDNDAFMLTKGRHNRANSIGTYLRSPIAAERTLSSCHLYHTISLGPSSRIALTRRRAPKVHHKRHSFTISVPESIIPSSNNHHCCRRFFVLFVQTHADSKVHLIPRTTTLLPTPHHITHTFLG